MSTYHDVADLDEDIAAAVLRRHPESSTRLVRLYRDEIKVLRGSMSNVRTTLQSLRAAYRRRFPGDDSFERRVVDLLEICRDGSAEFPGFGSFAWEFGGRRSKWNGYYLLRYTREVSMIVKVPRYACF